MGSITPAHPQLFVHKYIINYPNHEPRQDDPNYVDFTAYRKAHIATAVCPWRTREMLGAG